MKKSVKSFLLAVMALCLCATAGFAFTISMDVSASSDMTLSGDLNVLTTKKSVDATASKDPFIAPIASVDAKEITFKFTSDTGMAKISFDFPASTDVKLSPDAKWSAVTSDDLKKGITFAPKSDDLIVRVVLQKSSVDFSIAQITVAVSTDIAATGFKDAKFTLTTDVTNGVTPATFEASTTATSEDFEVLADITVISIDVASADVVKFSATTNAAIKSADASMDKFVITPASSATKFAGSFDVHFFMGTEADSTDVTLRFTISGDATADDETLVLEDLGTITFTSGADDSDTFAVSYDTYKSAYTASADETLTVTAAGTHTFTVSDLTDFTIEIDPGDATLVGFYFKNEEGTFEAAASTDETTIDASTAGTYRVVFSGTLEASGDATTEDTVAAAAAGDTAYFAVDLTVAESSEGDTDTDTDSDTPAELDPDEIADLEGSAETDFGDAANGAVNVADIDDTTAAELLEGYKLPRGVTSLAQLLTYKDEGDTAPRFAIMKLSKAPEVGDTLITRFIPAAKGAAPTDFTDVIIGTFVAKVASEYIIIDCKGLTNPSTKSTLNFASGIYALLARIYVPTAPTAEGFTTADDENGEAAINGAEYSGNPAEEGDTDTDHTSSKGSSSGCDAGFGALALLAVVPFIKKIRK